MVEERATHESHLLTITLRNDTTVPDLNEANVRHLLRRTEFVDRQARVTELLGLGSLGAAVDNVMDVPAVPTSVVFRPGDENWERGQHLAHFWFDQMANNSPKPFQEKMSLFWHGHFVSGISKVGEAELMQEQIDLYRTQGLSNLRTLARTLSTQVAMLRYLDNNENEAESPNQNFARELMELFLLEVGNYTEADVEAATAAWTGHSDDWQTGAYVWNAHYHDGSVKQFLGQTINAGVDQTEHGPETIDVIFGNGTVPGMADNVQNRGRPTRDVAAEFLSRKLWVDFAGTNPSAGIIATMRDGLIANNFDIAPWVRAMLMSDEFYGTTVKEGLVRSPIDWIVSLLYATGTESEIATPMWLLNSTGQAPFRPPHVKGWEINGYFVNAGAMEARAQITQGFYWRASSDYWKQDGTGSIKLRNGVVTQAELIDRSPYPDYIPAMTGQQVVDKMLDLMEVQLTPATLQTLVSHVDAGSVWERNNALLLILLAPELHTA